MPTEVERLQLLYEVNRRLATFLDLEGLVRYATRRTRELFRAEGCALLLCDHARREFRFPVASQSEQHPDSATRLGEIRFPIDRGIAGWVLAHGEATLVEDAAHDPRFFQGVDQVTQMTTRTVLCAPLRTEAGTIGVLEVVNPPPGSVTPGDLEFLEALAYDIAIAHQKVEMHELLHGELIGVRQVSRFAGMGLIGLGIVMVGGAVLNHLAWAIPLRELIWRPGPWVGLVATLTGLFLIALGRGWLVRPGTGVPPGASA